MKTPTWRLIVISFVAVHLVRIAPCVAASVPEFTIGQMPSRIGCDGKKLAFIVSNPAATSAPHAFQVEITPKPKGDFSFDQTTGLFTYNPDSADRLDMQADFSFEPNTDSQPDQIAIQTITISPQASKPEASLVADTKTVTLDPESTDYIVIATTKNPQRKMLNTAPDRETRNVEISGKTIVLQKDHPNGLYRFACEPTNDADATHIANSDIESFSIFGETVVVRSHFRLPQCNVTIYARELRFEDTNGEIASIDTTPLPFITSALQFQDGLAGMKGGNLIVHLSQLTVPPGSNQKRLILSGGTGQGAGQGKPGDPGSSMPSETVLTWWRREIPNVVYAINTWSPRVFFGTTPAWPGDGQPGTPPGKAGDGGSGGNLIAFCHSNITPYVDNVGGAPGPKAADAQGGAPGQPEHAVWVKTGDQPHFRRPIDVWQSHDAKPGLTAIARPGSVGELGTAKMVQPESATDWLHPAALQAIVDYAKDEYLNGDMNAACLILTDYSKLLSDSTDVPQEFAQKNQILSTEIQTLLHRIACNLDYFGNPAAWVPMLSFTTNTDIYKASIENAIRLEFLTYVALRSAEKQENAISAIKRSTAALQDHIALAQKEYAFAQAKQPDLEAQLASIASESAEIQSEIQIRIAQLQDQAAKTVSERHSQSGLLAGLHVLATICKVVPVYQPVLAAVGVGIDALATLRTDPAASITTLAGVSDAFSKANLSAAKQDVDNQINNLKLSNSANLKDYMQHLVAAGKTWGDALHKFADATRADQAPKTEVDAELQSIEAQDPTLKTLIDKIYKLNGLKEVFARDLAQVMQTTANYLQDFTASVSSIDALNIQASDTSGRMDHNALIHLRDMQRRARERLTRYKYYMAKAFEYEFLTPFPVDFQTSHLFDKIKQIIEGGNDEAWLNDDKNFDALSNVYKDELARIADAIITPKNKNAPKEITKPVTFSLTKEELASLNRPDGQLTINLFQRGLIDVTEENARLVSIGVDKISAHPLAAPTTANVKLVFRHSGKSMILSDGHVFLFNHYVSADSSPLTWTSRFNALEEEDPTQDSISPTDIALVTGLLDRTNEKPLDKQELYVHPAAWADIVISKIVTPTGVNVPIDEARVSFSYTYQSPLPGRVLLNVHVDGAAMPQIISDKPDFNGRSDARGSFTRIYSQDDKVTLVAQQSYGDLVFKEWELADGESVTDPQLPLNMRESKSVHLIYTKKVP